MTGRAGLDKGSTLGRRAGVGRGGRSINRRRGAAGSIRRGLGRLLGHRRVTRACLAHTMEGGVLRVMWPLLWVNVGWIVSEYEGGERWRKDDE